MSIQLPWIFLSSVRSVVLLEGPVLSLIAPLVGPVGKGGGGGLVRRSFLWSMIFVVVLGQLYLAGGNRSISSTVSASSGGSCGDAP